MQIQSKRVQMLCEGGIFLALALVLNALKLYTLPNGGSISLEMLPVFIFAIGGGGLGLLMGFALGAVSLFIDGAIAWGWQSLLLTTCWPSLPGPVWPVPGKREGHLLGTVLGAFVRFLIHFYSGVTIYAILAPTELFTITFTSPWMYSLVYNGSYMLIDTGLCLVILGLLYRPMHKYLVVSK